MTPDPNSKNGDNLGHSENSGLSNSRAEFAASLKRRLEALLAALQALQHLPSDLGRRDNFLRRIHALGASTRILGFAAAAEVLARAEQVIRTSEPDSLANDITTVRSQLNELPALVLRGQYSLAPPGSAAITPGTKTPVPQISEPLAAVVWGTTEFLETLGSIDRGANALEILTVEDSDRLKEACVTFGPDVLVLDAQQGTIAVLVDQLAQAPETATIPILVANVPDHAAGRLRELGARLILPFRTSASQLSRALLQLRHASFEHPAASPSPLGSLTLKELAERLSQEIRSGLVDAAQPGASLEHLELGDGTPIRAALWSALAQIREYVTESTDRRIQFATGPEGAVPLAPRGTPPTRHGGQAKLENLDLTGRRILVVDDDPAVAWFVGGTLRAAGATVTEVHDGSQALQLAYRLWPELIVSDVVMPGLDGFALCHATKRDVLLRDVPIILLSWKEDLLFRLRELGADADGYLRKEANASTIVGRVKELLLPRNALERRLSYDRETRGRLDGISTRLLLELAAALPRPVRIALRDATSHYDIRVRHGSLAAVSRTHSDSRIEFGESVLGPMLGTTAGRFSVVTDHEPCESSFTASLYELLAPAATRARAAQRLLSGLSLGLIERLSLDPDAFGSDLPMLPLSLRPVADELLRGTSPRQLLASGVASIQLLESLLSDVARRGAVLAVTDADGNDLLEREIAAIAATPSIVPPKPPSLPPQLFSFQLSPAAPPVADVASHRNYRDPLLARASGEEAKASDPTRPSRHAVRPESWHLNPAPAAPTHGSVLPASNAPPDDVDWALELSWDTPPPPAQNPAAPLETSSVKPITSGGFMRPSIPTLERHTPQETPDLANAVAQAVSEVGPSSSRLASAQHNLDPSRIGTTSAAPVVTQRSQDVAAPEIPPTNATDPTNATETGRNTPSQAQTTTQLAARLRTSTTPSPQAEHLSGPDERVRSQDTAAVAVPPEVSTSLPPAVHAQPDSVVAIEAKNAPEHAAPRDAPALPTADVPPQDAAAPLPQPPTQLAPLVLDALLHVSPPQGSASVSPIPSDQDDRQAIDADSDDPVFPLVTAPSQAVDVQPAIVLDTSGSQRRLPIDGGRQSSERAVTDPPQVRDTLRSQSGSQTSQSSPDAPTDLTSTEPATRCEPTSIPNSSSSDAQSPSTKLDQAPSEAPPSNSAIRRRSSQPTSAPPGAPLQQPRPIGLVQALGLAALAGIVTFAVTVPIAGWLHRHRQQSAVDPANAPNPLLVNSTDPDGARLGVPAASGSTDVAVTSPAQPVSSGDPASQQPAGSRVQDLGVPSGAALPPGQSLLEVATGGGHAIFVDDVFVGRGPVRVITVQAGHHMVRTRLNGTERSDVVDIDAGHSVRLSLEQP